MLRRQLCQQHRVAASSAACRWLNGSEGPLLYGTEVLYDSYNALFRLRSHMLNDRAGPERKALTMNDKSNTARKLVLLLSIAMPIALLLAALACQKLQGLESLSDLSFRARYTDDYIEKNKGKVLVEIPEVFELANIAIAISDYGLNDPWRVHKQGAYYKRLLEHFKPFKDHTLIAESDLNYNFTYNFRDNSVCYVFKGDKIIHGGLYSNMRRPNLFKKHLTLVEDFAKVSNFGKFYRDNLPYYQEQIRLYRNKVPVRRMWTWLEERFPARHDCYKVVFSPLIGSSHETCSFENNGFSETIMFISGPGEPQDFTDAVGEGLLSRVVFTEIDHNYVNRVTKQHVRRVNEAFADLDAWNKQTGYRRPEYTFNEYMTWAVFVLYAYDNYEKQDAEVIVKRSAVDTMVHHRKFVRFKEFAHELLKLYRNRAKGQSIPDLYPAILDWAEDYERQQGRQLADAIRANEKALESEPNAVTVHLKLADLYRQQGNQEQARKHCKATGLLDDDAWMIIGPFDNTDKAGFDTQYPPETQVDFTSEYPGKGKTAKWFRPKAGQMDGYVNLLQLIQPFEWAVAYAATCVQSPNTREVQLRIGSDDDVKVWLNGELVLSKAVDRGAAVDQDIIPIRLRTGPNQLLLKVCNRTGGWGFYMRITDKMGQPYDDLSFLPQSSQVPSYAGNGWTAKPEELENLVRQCSVGRPTKDNFSCMVPQLGDASVRFLGESPRHRIVEIKRVGVELGIYLA